MTAPKSVKLFDIHDIALAARFAQRQRRPLRGAGGRRTGRAQDFEGKDVKGKFVLSSGSTGATYAQAVQRGAIGVLGISAIGYQRAIDFPNQIVSSTVNAQPGTVAWSVTPEVHHELEAQLLRGDHITIRSITKSVEVPSKAEYVHAEIPGDGSTTQEVAISGHLYEGVIKQGANDDNSGCALTLEIGRAYLKLIADGKLPRPKRTINFQWVPGDLGHQRVSQRASGQGEEHHRHPELRHGGDPRRRQPQLLGAAADAGHLPVVPQRHRAEHDGVHRRHLARAGALTGVPAMRPSEPVESPRGSKDAFYIRIDKHYGSSDHVTYMQHGIPAVMFITWPDMWYHSSEDTPDKQDPTQYKRAAAVGLGALAVARPPAPTRWRPGW